jgi:putative endonuclease
VFYVYVLHSKADCGLYIGFSSDLRRRLREHRNGLADATAHRRPLGLIYYEAYVEEVDALGREQFLKSGAGRTYLRKQCQTYFARHPLRTTA